MVSFSRPFAFMLAGLFLCIGIYLQTSPQKLQGSYGCKTPKKHPIRKKQQPKSDQKMSKNCQKSINNCQKSLKNLHAQMQMTCCMKPYKHNSSDLIFAEIAGPSRIDFSRVRRSRASVLIKLRFRADQHDFADLLHAFFADQFLQENEAKSTQSYAMRITA